MHYGFPLSSELKYIIWLRVLSLIRGLNDSGSSSYNDMGNNANRDVSSNNNAKRLCEEISQDNKNAFGEFYNLTSGKLYGYLVKNWSNEVDANEILQETYIAFWKGRSHLAQVDFPTAYLFKMATRAIYKSSIRNKGRLTESIPEEVDFLAAGGIHEDLEKKEILKAIEEAVSLLPEQQRAVFRLTKYDGNSYKEVAEMLNLSVSAVSNYLELAKRKIRNRLFYNS